MTQEEIDKMIKKIKNGAIVVLVLLLVPLFLTGLFAFFWGFYGFSADIMFGEGSSPELTGAIFWKIYFIFFFVLGIILLFLLSIFMDYKELEDKREE